MVEMKQFSLKRIFMYALVNFVFWSVVEWGRFIDAAWKSVALALLMGLVVDRFTYSAKNMSHINKGVRSVEDLKDKISKSSDI